VQDIQDGIRHCSLCDTASAQILARWSHSGHVRAPLLLSGMRLLMGSRSNGTWDEDWADARHLYAGIWPDDELKDTIVKREVTLEIGGMKPSAAS
jgi:hypothetical protein